MLCQNCGKNEVNFHYTQVINGVKKEMALCDECAKKLGLEGLDFNMPINFSNFLGDFLNVMSDTDFLPSFSKTTSLMCNSCGMTYDDFINTGRFGCGDCYDTFENILDPLLKNIQGSNMHVGRRAKLTDGDKKKVKDDVQKAKEKASNKVTDTAVDSKATNSEKTNKDIEKEEKLEKLNNELKLAIKEERYEDAAKIRDQIKELS